MAEREINEEMTMTSNTLSPRARSIALAVGTALALLVFFWGPASDSAQANAPIHEYTAVPSSTQAGGHPDIAATFRIGNRLTEGFAECGCNDPKDIRLHMPAGVVGNPHVMSICSAAQMALFECSADAQAGFSVVSIFGSYLLMGLYRTHPQAGQAGLFVFALPLGFAIPQYVEIDSRTDSDFGLDFNTIGISHVLPFDIYATAVWGVPADPKNDIMRFAPKEAMFCMTNPIDTVLKGILPLDCFLNEGGEKFPVESSLPEEPFIQNPVTCVGPQESTLDVLAYDHGTDSASDHWPETTGCDQLSFDPSLAAKPTTTQADTASGLAVDLQVPQYQDPLTPSPSQIASTRIELPPGFTINPNAPDGKVHCTDEQAMIGSKEPAQCPEFSKIGTVTLDSAALPGPIHGYAYLGEPRPDNPYRVILTAFGFGTAVKLLNSVVPDPQTGQLTMVLDNLPQAPFSEFKVHIFGSERGLLATPTQCGTYPVVSTFTPWTKEISLQRSTQFFTVDSGPAGRPCPPAARPFEPSFKAGATDNTAAHHTSFALNFSRADGDQNLVRTDFSLPPGLLARLKGIPYCPEGAIAGLTARGNSGAAELASPACPAASRIGGVVTGSGAGSRPVYVNGNVYLGGPYKGSPLSVAVVVPAVVGPYDLGNVVVRSAIRVDPRTAQVSVVSDPLPQILEGVPLRLRSALITLDRDRFMLNPTNCDPFEIGSAFGGDQGAFAGPSAAFQVANCAVLDFAPKFGMKLSGGLNRRGHPGLRTTLRMTSDEANVKRAVVTLPSNSQLDQDNIDGVCTRVQYAADRCPAGSVYGSATAVTPLLDEPLRGPVYLRTSNNQLPDLVADLEGQIDIELAGKIDTVKGGLRTTFQSVPDAPVSRFVLQLNGGKSGLLQSQRSVCADRKKAKVKFVGQNGMNVTRKVKLQAACGKKRSQRRAKAGR
jgi:hypothetical protein